jgi:hypothetical protein
LVLEISMAISSVSWSFFFICFQSNNEPIKSIVHFCYRAFGFYYFLLILSKTLNLSAYNYTSILV